MKLVEWSEKQRVGASKLHVLLECKFGNAPSRQHLHKLLSGKTTPGLEVALLIHELTNGLVTLEEMVVDPIYKTPKREEESKESKELQDILDDELLNLLNTI